MKKMMTAVVAVVLLVSIGVNVYQAVKLRRYADRRERGLMKYYEDWIPTYPVDGLTLEDLSEIIGAIDREEPELQDRRILNLEMMDRDHVLIQTGIMKGGLWGGGKMFRFKRGPHGWDLEADKTMGWIS